MANYAMILKEPECMMPSWCEKKKKFCAFFFFVNYARSKVPGSLKKVQKTRREAKAVLDKNIKVQYS